MDIVQRLEANSTWEPNSGCRIWLGALVREHGVIKVAGETASVHRVAWEMERGPIPKGLWVLHNCGVGPCFNVNHLRLGTRDDNAADRQRAGGYVGATGGGLAATVRMTFAEQRRAARADRVAMTAAEVRRILSYDAATGEFRWNLRPDRDTSWNHRFAGEAAGSVLPIGYRYINVLGKLHLAHRLAWLYVKGEWPADAIDHINGDKADNRWCNLRAVTASQNGTNSKISAANKSGVKGVSWDRRRGNWVAMITKDRKQICLGNFATIPEAAAARQAAEIEYHGDHRRQGDK